MTRCHRCGTTDPARFYPAQPRRCKVCQADWMRTAAGIAARRRGGRAYKARHAGRVFMSRGDRTYRVTLLPGLGHVRLYGIRREWRKWWEYRYRPEKEVR